MRVLLLQAVYTASPSCQEALLSAHTSAADRLGLDSHLLSQHGAQ